MDDKNREGRHTIFTIPRENIDFSNCEFYHTMNIPGHGLVKGQWDIRGREQEYLGCVNFEGKRVLELGTADGFLCFYMESKGAEVITHDLSKEDSWDIVPFCNTAKTIWTPEEWKRFSERQNNGYWFAHGAMKSKAKACHSSIYEIPEQIGLVDISIFGSILLHVRDPFLALEKVLRLTKETVVIIDLPKGSSVFPTKLFPVIQIVLKYLKKYFRPSMTLLPDYRIGEPWNAWWHIPPELIVEFIGILGFEESEIKFSEQLYNEKKCTVYTVVGHRTNDKHLLVQ